MALLLLKVRVNRRAKMLVKDLIINNYKKTYPVHRETAYSLGMAMTHDNDET